MKKYDDNKTYNIEFKNHDSEQLMFIHFHCMVADKQPCNEAIFQIMSLWDDAKHWGQAYGGFLNYVQELDPQSMKYLRITEKRDGDKDD